MQFNRELLYALILCGMSLLAVFTIIVVRRKVYKIRPNDAFIILTTITLLVHGATNAEYVELSECCKFAILLSAYYTVRLLPHTTHKWIYLIIAIVGLIECFTALLQVFEITTSNHSYFSLTGHFDNPGPLGGFTALCLLINIKQIGEVVKKRKNKRLLAVLALSALIFLITLILTESRAAYFALFFGVLSLIPIKLVYKHHKVRMLVASAAVTVCFTIFTVWLYHVKRASADGRLLIWNVCTEMILDKPFIGSGIGSFPNTYMLAQGEYIRRHQETHVFNTATDNIYAFNEFLHLIVETGIVGFILLSIFTVIIFYSKTDLSRSLLFAWIVFSCFSYPFDILPLAMMFFILFAMLPVKCVARIDNSLALNSISTLMLSVVIALSVYAYLVYGKLQKRSMDCTYALNTYQWLKNNQCFSMTYLLPLCNKSTDVTDYNTLKKVTPSVVTYNALGKYLIRIHASDEAEKILKCTIWMSPQQLMAKYTLWKLYVFEGRNSDAREMARNILNTKIKVTNSFTINALKEVKEYLNTENKTTRN